MIIYKKIVAHLNKLFYFIGPTFASPSCNNLGEAESPGFIPGDSFFIT
jgi:hypothetical protein